MSPIIIDIFMLYMEHYDGPHRIIQVKATNTPLISNFALWSKLFEKNQFYFVAAYQNHMSIQEGSIT